MSGNRLPANVVLVPAASLDPITAMEISSSHIIIMFDHVREPKPPSYDTGREKNKIKITNV
jgi:hypothetical protein